MGRLTIRLGGEEEIKITEWSQQLGLPRSIIIRLLLRYAMARVSHPSELFQIGEQDELNDGGERHADS
ncbi:MAG: hypothetical protein QW555_07965 [Nitrososphaerota archaeon]